jgi:hypothetical protein
MIYINNHISLMDNLNIFFAEIHKIYDDNCKMSKELELFKNNLSSNKTNYNTLLERNKELENIIKNLEEKNNLKSSKMIWESTQQIIKEKDTEIDFLKKKLMYYERQNLIKSQSNNDKIEIDNQVLDIKKNIIENKTEKAKKKSKKILKIIDNNVEVNIDDLERDLLAI